jgi:hypothetical protein
MTTFAAPDPDVIPFARRSADYLYRNGYAPTEVARALAAELEVSPEIARHIALERRGWTAA